MKIDFIHVGFHKTASTYMQKYIFPQIEQLSVVNLLDNEMDSWFYKNFININPYRFSKVKFIKSFYDRSKMHNLNENNIFCISDENISGDIYTGIDSRELMLRMYSVFGGVDILIVIRNQIDYILSAYGNYIIHGGTSKLSQWLKGQETRFGQLIDKLKYSYMVKNYQQVFGKENVYVVQYEKLFDEKSSVKSFIVNLNLRMPPVDKIKVNPGRGLFSNKMLMMLNKIGISKFKGRQKLSGYFRSEIADRIYVRKIIADCIDEFHDDNKNLEILIDQKLSELYY